ncbi:MAG: tetratricopeptide repeat protein, partial [Anaerolineae bacterium]
LDKSLLHRQAGIHSEPRYIMLETVREYGLERVAAGGHESALRARHMRCILQLINYVEQTGLDPFGVQLRRLFDDEIHNERAALVWATEHDVEVALLLAAALMNWLSGRGPLAEGRLLIERILALPGASAHTIPRAKFLYEAGCLMGMGGELDQAKACLEESLALSQDLGYHKGEAEALRQLGRLHCEFDHVAAQHYFETALVIYRALSDPGGIAFVTALMALLATDQSDIPQARALAEESLAVAQQAGFPNPWAVMALGCIGYYVDGDLDEARSLLEQSLAHMDSKGFKASVLQALGSIATRQGDFAAAHVLLDEALVLIKELGTEQRIFYLRWAQLSQAEDDLTQAVQLSRASLAVSRVHPDGRTEFLLHLTALATALNQYELAARLLGVTISVDEVDLLLWRLLGEDYRRLADAARAHLGADRFDTAWTQGRVSTFEAAVDEAISILEATLAMKSQPAPT